MEKLIQRLEEEADLYADHAFISVKCSDLKQLLALIRQLQEKSNCLRED